LANSVKLATFIFQNTGTPASAEVSLLSGSLKKTTWSTAAKKPKKIQSKSMAKKLKSKTPVPDHQSERTDETTEEATDEEAEVTDEHRGTTIGIGTAGEGPGPGLDPVIDIPVGDLTDETGAGPGLDPETEVVDDTRQPETLQQNRNTVKINI